MSGRPDPARVLAGLQASRKYARVHGDALARVAGRAAREHRTFNEAVKAARRRLHQVLGAFVDGRALEEARGLAGDMPGWRGAPGGEPREVREASRKWREKPLPCPLHPLPGARVPPNPPALALGR